jgi:hypothetical protein
MAYAPSGSNRNKPTNRVRKIVKEFYEQIYDMKIWGENIYI